MKQSFPDLTGPAAIAFSGGGDSTAMLHAFRDDPAVGHAFIIDHALRAESAKEAERAADIAASFGYHVQIDRWAHDGISTGLQAKARAYRYAALGRLCRAAGVTRLMTAHTEDDQAETLLMRLERQTGWRGLAGMPGIAYAPIWPALASVSLHRPWLTKSRAELRIYNREYGLSFIDDPSNENTEFARIRARQALAADPNLRADLLAQQKEMRIRLDAERESHERWLSGHARFDPQGYIETNAIPPAELLLHILNAASGRGEPIERAKRLRLCREMESPDFKAATLGGAWVVKKTPALPESEGYRLMFLRDRVAVTGRADTPRVQSLVLKPDEDMFWDGRFVCRAKCRGVRVKTGGEHSQDLRQLPDFKAFFDISKDVRESLPIFFLGDRAVGFGSCDTEFVTSIATSASRLQALFKGLDTVSL